MYVPRGRKAVRTETAPIILTTNRQDQQVSSLNRLTNRQGLITKPIAQTQSLSHIDHDAIYRPLYRTDVQSKYSLSQTLKESMESVVPPGCNTPPQSRHRRELVRCWSRERITRSELVLSIRTPNTQHIDDLNVPNDLSPPNSAQQTSFGSEQSLHSNVSSLYRVIPIKSSQDLSDQDPSYANLEFPSIYSSDRLTPANNELLNKDTQTELHMETDTIEHSTQVSEDTSDESNASNYSDEIVSELFDGLDEVNLFETSLVVENVSVPEKQSVDTQEHWARSGEVLQHSTSASLYSTASSGNSNLTPTSSLEDDEDAVDMDQSPALWSNENHKVPDSKDTEKFGVTCFRAVVQRDKTGYGIRVCGNMPVSVHSVRKGGTAEQVGLQPGDQIIEVNGQMVESMNHDDVVKLIRAHPTVYFLLRRRAGNHMPEQTQPRFTKQGSFRQLSVDEDPILRGQSKRYKKKVQGPHTRKSQSATATCGQRIVELEDNVPGSLTDEDDVVDVECSDGNKGDAELTRRLSVLSRHSSPKTQIEALLQAESVPGDCQHNPSLIPPKSPEIDSAEASEASVAPPSNMPNESPSPKIDSTHNPGLVMGRKFSDEEDNEDLHMRYELEELSKRFEKASLVLNSPSRFGVFLNYLFAQSHDPAPALFYLVNQYFQRALQESKELTKDQKRVSIEIFSTFLHEKSPLRLDIPTPVVLTTLGNVMNSLGAQTFNAAAEAASSIVQTQVTRLVQEIQHGLDTWKPSRPVNLLLPRSREEEMNVFEMCLTPHLQALAAQIAGGAGDKVSAPKQSTRFSQETALALYVSLLTAYRAFVTATGADTSDQSASAGSLSRSGIPARSMENLANAAGPATGSAPWPQGMHFCAKLKQKSHGHLFSNRRGKISLRNHSLTERAFERLEECWICGQLLWGLGPQGLGCANCELTVHVKCKSGIKESCSKEGRRSGIFGLQSWQNASTNGAAISDVVSGLPPGSSTTTEITDASLQQSPAPVNTGIVSTHHMQSSPKPSRASISGPSFSDASNSETSLDQLNRASLQECDHALASYVSMMKSKFEGTQSLASRVTRSNSLAVPQHQNSRGSTCELNSEAIPDLISTDWSNDAEMQADESFEAATEINRHFPTYKIPIKDTKNEDYVRMLCLLEFHQKVQFMVRHLKQYEYLLLRTWPKEHKSLYNLLCLDQIPILIELFRSLVSCIEQTKTPTGYAGMAEAVLGWLTDNSNENLKSWARHCQALSCTNMLDCVNKSVNDYAQRRPDVLRLLQMKHNKFVLVDGLKQMRILYFNLPMIANKIMKDLEKRTKSYREEAKIWQKIYNLLSSLPATIDNVCMPLVKRINKGQLQSNFDKKDSIFRQNDPTVKQFQDLLLFFPRTLFRFWVVAHAEVAIDKLTVTSQNKVNHDYVRERTPMLCILLHDALMLMVKDGDRYTLRVFKSAREHASGSLSSVQSERIPPSTAHGTERPSQYFSPSHATNVNGPSSASLRSNNSISSGSSSLVNSVANVAGSVLVERHSGSSSSKIAPILTLHSMYISRGERMHDKYLLNIVSMDPTVLVRLLFNEKSQLEQWSALLKERSIQAANKFANLQRQKQRISKPHTQLIPKSPTATEAAPETEAMESVQGEELPEDSKLEFEDNELEDEMTPSTHIVRVISGCTRLNEKLRGAICDALNISDGEYASISELMNLSETRNLSQLVLAQFNLTEKWLDCLTHSLALIISQREQQRRQPRDRAISNPSIASEPGIMPEVASKGAQLEAHLGRNKSFGCGDSRRSDVVKTASTPNLWVFEGEPVGETLPVGGKPSLNVQDHRRPAKRSISALVSKRPFYMPNSQVFAQAESIARQMVLVMQRLKTLTDENAGDSSAESGDRRQATDSIHSSAGEDSVNFEDESDEDGDFECRERSDTLCAVKQDDTSGALGSELTSGTIVITGSQEVTPIEEPDEHSEESSPTLDPGDSGCISIEEEISSDRLNVQGTDDTEDQATPTARESPGKFGNLEFFHENPVLDIDSKQNPPHSTSIDRNESQKSTTSSGFIEY